jgi:hypothetical protein
VAIYQVVSQEAPNIRRGPGTGVHTRDEIVDPVATCHVSNRDDAGTLLCGGDPAGMYPVPRLDFDEVPDHLQCPACRPHWPAHDAEQGYR